MPTWDDARGQIKEVSKQKLEVLRETPEKGVAAL